MAIDLIFMDRAWVERIWHHLNVAFLYDVAGGGQTNSRTLNAGNHNTQNKSQPVLLVAGSRFVEMFVPEVTVTCK